MDHSQGLAYYFFEAAVDNLDEFFASLASQLRSQAAQKPKAERMTQASTASSGSSQSLLADTIGFFDHTILVIDGLDKVGTSGAQEISRFIWKQSNRGAAIQLFATSRMSIIVNDAFRNPTFGEGWIDSVKTLYLEPSVIDVDINKYLQWRMQPNSTSRPHLVLEGWAREIIWVADGM